MEHEVVVQLPATVVQQALRDRDLLVRSVPGLSIEAEAAGDELAGRLRLRIGGSTITYKGVLSLIEGREGVLTALAEGQESRGSGEVTATVRLSVQPGADDTSSALHFTADLTATGRLAEFDAVALGTAGRRLLDRFANDLAAEVSGAEPEAATILYLEDHTAGFPGDLDDDLADLIAFADEPTPPTEPAELPEPTRQPAAEDPALEYLTGDLGSAPVRRSIVGRSAEEVDHAPPRGRYAPALPARSARARAATRWSGPEQLPQSDRTALPWMIGGGVALIGGAVVLVRALRKR
ncbi:carbon monoxide dehydrogenase subunit G [Kitasatospora gansuensis]|uniref:Carbon monoxide dehydrogenase subunit G n=1 Tax=Kitasatospora gansuensis TaxID=258050 RepID=A0A7W7WHG4_9ACTN|nr:SRPBCC domain-containing protein [Kitasatospora gansuensis]MBB4947727.1 carbon monoxide dehydrogenase subunit G [Kitasatospora gansuensis]